jgi:GH24 family phage-related lysozyme (muramidase)
VTDAEFRAKLKVFEGYAEHMYLDSVGEVMIGVGLMLPSAQAAKSASLGFYDRKSRESAAGEAIEKDFERVRKAPKGMFPPENYKRYTELAASAARLKTALDRRIRTAKSDAVAFYPQYRQLPSSVRYALLDMAFNLGRTRLSQYRKLKVALQNSEWALAAEQSHRVGIQAVRNRAIADWIRKGARSR